MGINTRNWLRTGIIGECRIESTSSISHGVNIAENAIFRTREEGTSILGEKFRLMLGITAGARKKGKPRMRWMDDIKSVTGLSVNDLNQLLKGRKSGLLVNNTVKKRKWTNV